jgi:peptidoglycan/LPS O-acetylase OafA/YrhL
MEKLEKSEKKSTRIGSLDMLRGIAVCTMVLAHTIAFFYSGQNKILQGLLYFGDTVSFTAFLLVSGASIYLAYFTISVQEWKRKRKKYINRLLKLLLGYYIVAVISTLKDFPWPPSIHWFENLGKIIIFINVPGYTEFVLAFVLFGFLVLLGRKLLTWSVKNKIHALLSIGGSYLFGFILYTITLPEPLLYYKSLLAGESGWYRFPVFQYFCIFLLGMLLGKVYAQKREKMRLFFKITLFPGIYCILSLIFPVIAQFPYVSDFQRWPPSLSFLSLGLTFAIISLMLAHIKIKSISFPFLRSILQFIGIYAFSFYIIHISIVQLEFYFWGYTFLNPFFVYITYFALLGMCAIFVLFSQKFRYIVRSLFIK